MCILLEYVENPEWENWDCLRTYLPLTTRLIYLSPPAHPYPHLLNSHFLLLGKGKADVLSPS